MPRPLQAFAAALLSASLVTLTGCSEDADVDEPSVGGTAPAAEVDDMDDVDGPAEMGDGVDDERPSNELDDET